MTDVERVRARPENFVRLPVAEAVVLELVALSIVETTHARAPVRIRVALDGPLSGTLTDTGRGMRLEPDAGDTVSHAQRALTSIYPVRAADPEVDAVLAERVWGPQGSLGPVAANTLCAAFRFESRRDGEAWAQDYAAGVPSGPAYRAGAGDGHGTTIRFTVDPAYGDEPLAREQLEARFAGLRARLPGVDLVLA